MNSVDSSPSIAKCATPLFVACVCAPPSSSCVTSSCVTARTTSGPVMYICPLFDSMNTKSMIAGEYTPPPAVGPQLTEICGTTPEARVLRRKMSP